MKTLCNCASVVLACTALSLITVSSSHAQSLDQAWFARCDAGDAEACNRLGLYYERTGQPADAAAYFDATCRLRDLIGCSNLAELVFDGRGVQRDYDRAFALFNDACSANIRSGCAGSCLTLAAMGQLGDNDRQRCRADLEWACQEENNLWMCGRTLPGSVAAAPQLGGCQGQNYARAVAIIEMAWLAGLQIGQSADFAQQIAGLLAVSQNLAAQAQQLPSACQALVQEWVGAIAQMFQSPPSGQQCMQGVCCDDGGCYG